MVATDIPGRVFGREHELEILQRVSNSAEAEFVCVYGRRRVGKTFLVRSFFNTSAYQYFELAGTKNAALASQLRNFSTQLSEAFYGGLELAQPVSWPDAFQKLIRALNAGKTKRKRTVIFFDELPWLASRKSGFLEALDYFWNSWGVRQQNIILIVCGSAASWILQNVIDSKGGLHNRITTKIKLNPFSVSETANYLKAQRVKLGPKQVLELYMCVGGIPHYLRHISRNRSVPEIIDELCSKPTGLLTNEFDNLYAALYDNPEQYLKIVGALAGSRKGLTRDEIASRCRLSPSGQLSKYLNALAESDFILEYVPFGKTAKFLTYRLVDEYTLFFLRWLQSVKRTQSSFSWAQAYNTTAWKVWAGISFEGLCHKHIGLIKEALGIRGVQTQESVWNYKPKSSGEKGAQIDLLIDRADGVINLCEIKFHNSEYSLNKQDATTLAHKRSVFIEKSQTRKAVLITMISARGVKENDYYKEVVSDQVVVERWLE